MKNFTQLEQEAQIILDSVKDFPEKRLALRQAFYRKYGLGKLTEYGYGNSNDPLHTPPFTDTSYPTQTKEQLINIMQQWLQDNMGYFWTNATTLEYPTGFDLSLFFDMYGGQSTSGEEKLCSQYWRVNINPWDRYTLSVPKSGSYRLKTDEPGYKNLFLTGD